MGCVNLFNPLFLAGRVELTGPAKDNGHTNLIVSCLSVEFSPI